jgi:peptidyl-prolyl cis-trans isomerase SurA
VNAPLLLSLALAAATPAAPTASPAPKPDRRTVDRVAATVNGEVITLSDLTRRAGGEWERAERLPAGAEREKARAAALRRAFDLVLADKLFEAQAKELELEASDAQIDAAISDIKKRNGFDDAQLDAALREQGIDRATFRGQIRRELQTYSLLQYKVRNKVKLTDEDLKAYYQSHPKEFAGETEIHVRHIFLPLPADAPEAEVARVTTDGQKVLQRLRTGEDFAAVAKEVSKAPTATEGGDLGWLKRGSIQKSLEDAAFALKDGQLSGLVRAGPGLHILRVEERRLGGAKSFEQAKEEIRERLLSEQGERYRDQYLAELRKDAMIDLKLPELKAP